jgi:hypothetical protein
MAFVLGSFPAVAGADPKAAATSPSASSAALERLKSLVGRWRGSVEWTGARTGKGEMSVRYSLTGNGSAVVEDLESDGTVAMTSVYHLDGPDLRLTHYCGANNQPRLKASEIDDGAGHLRFTFVDITNLKTPETGHVSAVELRLHDPGRMTLVFTFVGGGKESYERIELARLPEP